MDASPARYAWPVPDEPYRTPQPIAPDPYLLAWQDLRRRRLYAWAVLIAYVAGAMCILWMYKLIAGHMLDRSWGLALLLPTLPVHFAFNGWRQAFRCPRCGERFHVQRGVSNPSTRQCMNCGLEMGTPKSAVLEAQKQAPCRNAR
jgi:hypothetical protein